MKHLLLTCIALCIWGCVMDATTSSMEQSTNADITTLPYTFIGDTILPLAASRGYTYHFLKLDTAGFITDSTTNFNLFIEAYDKEQSQVYRFSMLDARQGNLIIWKGSEVAEDSMGIYIIGTYNTVLDTEQLFSDTIFWLPQYPQSELRELAPGHTIQFLGNAHDYVLTFPYNDVVTEKAMLFEEKFIDSKARAISLYYYMKKGVGLLGWERYQGERLTDIGTLANMHYRYEYDDAYDY